MSSNTHISTDRFFSVTLQDHKVFGSSFAAHIVELLSKEGGIYTVVDNVFPENIEKWNNLIPVEARALVKIIAELSDSSLFAVVGKGKKSVANFYHTVQTDAVFGNYVRSFFERRIAKCFDIIVANGLPVFYKDKKFNNLYQAQLLNYMGENAKPVFTFTVTPTETKYSLEAICQGETIKLRHKHTQVVTNDPCIVMIGQTLLRFDGIDAKKLTPFFTKEFVSVPKTAEKKYFESFVLNAIKTQIVVANGFTIETLSPEKDIVLYLESRLNGDLALTLYFKYGEKKYLSQVKPQNEVSFKLLNNSYHFTKFSRDASWEAQAKSTLVDLGLTNTQGASFYPVGVNSDYELITWVNDNANSLIGKGIDLVQHVNAGSFYIKGYNLDLKTKLENDWFDIYGMVKLHDLEFPFINLRKSIIKGIREYILPSGDTFIIPNEWFAKYKLLLTVGSVDNDKLTLTQSAFGFVQQAQIDSPDAENLNERFESISLTQRVVVPDGLNAELRDYQKQGLLWLQLLYESGMGGCLADDMGLGKTIQALSILLFDAERRLPNTNNLQVNALPQMGRTSLLVVPTSLLFNWQSEIERFAPSLTVYQFTGSNRTRLVTDLISYDIVLTTYGVLRNEIDLLKNVRFNYVILDESQTIKNPASKVYRSAVLLKAKHFLSLSGTPIENSLTDLWAQLNFLNRGMLGSLRTFREHFVVPIEKGNDEQAQISLKKLIHPFIMRRTKHEVAPELPELSQEIIYCNLTDQQKSIYEEEKSAIRNHILDSIDSVGYSQSAIPILRGLTRLRQISNHPKMLEDYSVSDSGKFEEIIRTIETLVGENHKVLVFSSFVKHLRLVQQQIEHMGIGYQLLIGSTTNRKKVVESFQNDSGCHVFLISIKAGGVGLNLTAADYILVLDPWWNPAVENQAIARAHRIGQDKPVFVYRFISVGTVEEKIQRLQESKLLLSSNMVGNSNPLSAIDKEQLMEIIG
ncbi:MAG: DEAD/DEAH box helicase [Tenuifilaceae bacterium]|nr:DEAD/DEAH box helicase [Tenuifilaceae bacterium]